MLRQVRCLVTATDHSEALEYDSATLWSTHFLVLYGHLFRNQHSIIQLCRFYGLNVFRLVARYIQPYKKLELHLETDLRKQIYLVDM